MDGKSEKRIDLGTEARLLFFWESSPVEGRAGAHFSFPEKANWLQSRDQSSSSWLPRTVLRAAMGKNLTSIPGTSGPSHPLQSTIQPILGVLEQFWPKTLLSRRIPQLAPAWVLGGFFLPSASPISASRSVLLTIVATTDHERACYCAPPARLLHRRPPPKGRRRRGRGHKPGCWSLHTPRRLERRGAAHQLLAGRVQTNNPV